jgi:hypothetical protein
METRRDNRPVSRSCASSLLTLDMRLPGTRSGKPRGRDPPLPRRRVTSAPSMAYGGRATAGPRREDLLPRPQNGERFTSTEVVYGVTGTDVTVLPEYGVSP